MIGTLMWIGDTSAVEFRGALEYSLVNVSQIAFRRDADEAISRPASDLRWILLAQANRHWLDPQPLIDRYPAARAIALLGPLCQGLGSPFGIQCCDWSRWQEVLPGWLGIDHQPSPRCRSVAVIASTLSSAEPLLELAESAGATAVWCRHPQSKGVRNVDAVWWDDSIATPACQATWHSRLTSFSGFDRGVQHAWIANSPTPHAAREAQAAGVQWLVAKPHRIDALLGMLERPAEIRPLIQRRAA